MSRVGQNPIPIPDGVTVERDQGVVAVSGPKGTLSQQFNTGQLAVRVTDGQVHVERLRESRVARSLHGLTRSLIFNMVKGVTEGFEKALEVQGVGYRVVLQGSNLVLQLGYSHPITYRPPEGISFEVRQRNIVVVRGIDKQLVGQVAAEIRGFKKVEPYKGKGIRYVGEHVRRKVGKAGA